MNVELIPVAMGALGIPHRKLNKRLGKIGIKIKIVEPQKTAIIYSARILQKILEL